MSEPITLDERMALVERHLVDHAKSFSAYSDEIAKINIKVTNIEDWRHDRNVAAAREDERDKSLYHRLDEMEKSIEAIQKRMDTTAKDQKDGQSRIMILLAMAVISPIMTIIVQRLLT